MYALSLFLRVVRFLTNTLVGLLVGFVLGYIAGQGVFSISGYLAGLGL